MTAPLLTAAAWAALEIADVGYLPVGARHRTHGDLYDVVEQLKASGLVYEVELNADELPRAADGTPPTRTNLYAVRATSRGSSLLDGECPVCGASKHAPGPECSGLMYGERIATYALETIDGGTVSGLSFPRLREEIGEVAPETMDEIRLLAPGETTRQGGGAQPVWSVTREASR